MTEPLFIPKNKTSTEAITDSQLLHRLINQLDEIVIIMDYQGNFTLTNDAFNTLTGYEAVPTSKDFAVALGQDNFALMISTIEQTISTQTKQTLPTLPFVTQDNRISYFSLNFQPFRYSDNDQVLIVASDITKERNLSLVKDLVIEINHMLSRAHSLNEYFDLVLDRLLKTISHADLGSVLIIDEHDILTIVSAKGYSPEYVKDFHLPLKDAFYYRLNPSLSRHPIIINDIDKLDMSGFTDLLQNENSLPVYSSLSCPIFLNDTLHGLINIDSSKNNVYTIMDIEVMTFLMDQMSFVISAYYSQEQMRYLSLHDQLTGLLNRWHLETISEKIIPLCLRHHQSFIFTIVDLNNLKVVNDQHGHEIGDNYLKTVSRLLKSHTRKSDLIIRIGGDEIVLVYYSSTIEHCEKVLDAINVTLNTEMQSLGLPDGLCGMAYGLAKFPDEAGTLKSLMRIADERMYTHKQTFRVHNT